MRHSWTRALDLTALVLIAPFVGLYRLKLVGFDTTGTFLSLIPGEGGIFLRRAWYRCTLQRCGEHLCVQFGAVISSPESCVGDECFVGHYTRVSLVDIGNDVMIGEHSSVIAGGSQYGFMRSDIPMRLQPGVYTRTTIGDDVWIGAGALISADVASHSVIGGAAALTRPSEEWQILAGVPAEVVGIRPGAARAARRSRAAEAAAVTAAAAAASPEGSIEDA